ncbi:PEP-CTERM sorting domain-containing protein [Rugamonas sp. CCM 8940]|nr:PEP-CTERM sorting domain-containing protein [Rugamonas sp. CCM 8940]
MEAWANYGVNGNESAPLSSGLGLSGTSVDVLDFSGANGSQTGLHSYGDTSGNFGSRASGSGVYNVYGGFRVEQWITNTSAVSQFGSYHFQITPGMLQNSIGSALTGNHYVESGLLFDLRLGDTSVWASGGYLHSDASGSRFGVFGDTSLYAGGGTLYNVLGQSRDIDLGVITAGQTIKLTYTLTTSASGYSAAGADRWVPPSDFVVPEGWYNWDGCTRGMAAAATNGDGCVVGPGDVVHTDGHWLPGDVSGSHASSGDPFSVHLADHNMNFNVNGGSNTFGQLTMTPVPEPTGYAMLLGGMSLMGVLAARRRRRDGR